MPRLELDSIEAEIAAGATIRAGIGLARLPLAASITVGALLLAAAPAPAQLAPGKSGASSMRYIASQEELWRSVWTFGICFASRRPRDAGELLATTPGTAEEAEVYRRLLKGEQSCLGSLTFLNVPPRMVRGAIAEGMYRRVAKREAQPALALPAGAAEAGQTLSATARCYVAQHAAEAHLLIFETGPGGKKEVEAIGRLLPDYQRCLPAGLQVSMSPIQLRFALAEALYHAVPAAGGGATITGERKSEVAE